jgi:hypothetical protein
MVRCRGADRNRRPLTVEGLHLPWNSPLCDAPSFACAPSLSPWRSGRFCCGEASWPPDRSTTGSWHGGGWRRNIGPFWTILWPWSDEPRRAALPPSRRGWPGGAARWWTILPSSEPDTSGPPAIPGYPRSPNPRHRHRLGELRGWHHELVPSAPKRGPSAGPSDREPLEKRGLRSGLPFMGHR